MNTLISTSADRGIGVKLILNQFGLFLGSESKGPPPGVLRCCSTISRCLSITFWSDFSRQSLPEMMSLLMICGSFSNRAASYSFLADSRIRSLRGFAPGRVVREVLGGGNNVSYMQSLHILRFDSLLDLFAAPESYLNGTPSLSVHVKNLEKRRMSL